MDSVPPWTCLKHGLVACVTQPPKKKSHWHKGMWATSGYRELGLTWLPLHTSFSILRHIEIVALLIRKKSCCCHQIQGLWLGATWDHMGSNNMATQHFHPYMAINWDLIFVITVFHGTISPSLATFTRISHQWTLSFKVPSNEVLSF